MVNILSISSQVVRGAVGNSVAAFALQRLGHTAWQIPTILLSSHPGHGSYTGTAATGAEILALWDGLKAQGWQSEIDAVLTGYMANRDVAVAAVSIVRDVKMARPSVMYLCDPAVGDEPGGLYVEEGAAAAIRDGLLPMADIATPNRFELAWLTGTGLATGAEDAIAAAETMAPDVVIATSIPANGEAEIANVLRSANGSAVCATSRHAKAPHGTGDLFSALFLAGRLKQCTDEDALGFATAAVRIVLEASFDHDELQIVAAQDAWVATKPDPTSRITP